MHLKHKMNSADYDHDFKIWWDAFPRKVGKLAARQAYEKARRQWSAETLLQGIERYLRAKPGYADIVNPKTFFTSGRFLDEADEPRGAAVWDCPHEPHCLGRSACDVKQRIAAGKALSR